MTWPAEIDIGAGAIGDGVVVGVSRDADDVQRLVVLKMQSLAAPTP